MRTVTPEASATTSSSRAPVPDDRHRHRQCDDGGCLGRIAELRGECRNIDVKNIAALANDDGTVGRDERAERLTELGRLRSAPATTAELAKPVGCSDRRRKALRTDRRIAPFG